MWEKVKIGDVVELARNGVSIKQSESQGGIPITRIETISDGYIDSNKFGYAGIQLGEYSDYYLKKGDILMSHINSWKHLGKTALVSHDCEVIHGMNLLLLRPKKEMLLSSYANYYFSTKPFKKQLHRISNQSVNQSSFSVTKLKDLLIPLPPLHIQEQIVNTLDKADALRKKDQKLLKKYDELAQSIFYDMFGDPLSSSTEEKKALSSVCQINPRKSEINIENDQLVSFIPMEDVDEKGNVKATKTRLYSQVASGFTYFREGDVLFAKITPCMENGKGGIACELVNGIGFGSTEFHVIRPNDVISSEYIESLLSLKNVRLNAEKYMTGSAGQKRVSKSFFDALYVPYKQAHLIGEYTLSYKKVKGIRQLAVQNVEFSTSCFNSLMSRFFS